MEQRISLITLGVADIPRARAFYQQLGWEGQETQETVFIQARGIALVLWGRDKLALDCGIADDLPAGFSGVVLAHNVRSEAEVDRAVPADQGEVGGEGGVVAGPGAPGGGGARARGVLGHGQGADGARRLRVGDIDDVGGAEGATLAVGAGVTLVGGQDHGAAGQRHGAVDVTRWGAIDTGGRRRRPQAGVGSASREVASVGHHQAPGPERNIAGFTVSGYVYRMDGCVAIP